MNEECEKRRNAEVLHMKMKELLSRKEGQHAQWVSRDTSPSNQHWRMLAEASEHAGCTGFLLKGRSPRDPGVHTHYN